MCVGRGTHEHREKKKRTAQQTFRRVESNLVYELNTTERIKKLFDDLESIYFSFFLSILLFMWYNCMTRNEFSRLVRRQRMPKINEVLLLLLIKNLYVIFFFYVVIECFFLLLRRRHCVSSLLVSSDR